MKKKYTSKKKQNTKGAKAPLKKTSSSSKKWLEQINWNYIAGGIFLLALILRIWNVGVLTLWVDEYQIGQLVQKSVRGNEFEVNYNKLLYYFTNSICHVFGVSEFTLRLPAVLFGSLSIPIIYLTGKKLFNEPIGALAALLTASSIFLITWSRVAYNYGLAIFGFMAVVYVFLRAFEDTSDAENIENFFTKHQLNKQYLIAFPFVFIFGFFAHLLNSFILFGIGIYCTLAYLNNLTLKTPPVPKLLNKYLPISILFTIGCFLIFTEVGLNLIKPVLALGITAIDSIIPDLALLKEKWDSEPYKVYNMYSDILKYDFKQLYFVGITGFLLAFFIKRKSAIFLISFFGTLLFLLSFIFRSPALPNYLSPFYPLFLMSTAVAIYFMIVHVPKTYIPFVKESKWANLLYFLPLLLIPFFFRSTEIFNLLSVKYKSGYVVDKKLSQWSYINWKDAVNYVKKNMKDGDVVMATIPQGVNYYMNWDKGAIQFRQRYLDSHQTGKYLEYVKENPGNLDGNTIPGLQRTITERPRGWLLADYYFNNVSTSDEARNLVFKNMKYHYDAVPSGDVSIYSWDNNTPKQNTKQEFVILVGRNRLKRASKKLTFNVNQQYLQDENLEAKIAVQANSKQEGFFVLNEKHKYYIPANTTNEIQEFTVKVKKESVKLGSNIIQFGTEFLDHHKDQRKGYSVHSITIY